jgi:hypothetical protein
MRQQGYGSEDSIDTWTLTPEDHALVAGKSRANRLAFAALLLFFRANGRFPEASEIHPSVLARIAEREREIPGGQSFVTDLAERVQ